MLTKMPVLCQSSQQRKGLIIDYILGAGTDTGLRVLLLDGLPSFLFQQRALPICLHSVEPASASEVLWVVLRKAFFIFSAPVIFALLKNIFVYV